MHENLVRKCSTPIKKRQAVLLCDNVRLHRAFEFRLVCYPDSPYLPVGQYPFGATRYINFLKPFQVLARDSSSGPLGQFTFLYGHKKYNRGSGRKKTKSKRTIWAWVNSKCKKGSFVTLHSLCLCRLSPAYICAKFLQATRNADSSLTAFLTADRYRLKTANSSCLSSSLPLDSISRRQVSSVVRCRLPLNVTLRQLTSGFSGFLLPTALTGVPLPTALASLGPAFPPPLVVSSEIPIPSPLFGFTPKQTKGSSAYRTTHIVSHQILHQWFPSFSFSTKCSEQEKVF